MFWPYFLLVFPSYLGKIILYMYAHRDVER